MTDNVKYIVKKGKGIFNKIKDIVKRGRHLNQGKSRLRNCCPDCGSVAIIKRTRKQGYVCRSCRWKGKNIKKVEWPPKSENKKN